MGLKYIYAGYAKTGTKSMAEAFRILGYTVHDAEENLTINLDAWIKFMSPKYTKEEKIDILREMYKDQGTTLVEKIST